ncbi:RDD family protein [Mucilaginibacter mali]|uniref:RDD family protein n=1 Tax=Mucilaginibacter mali TaxID=2740462 RepID=A0A7D4Q8M0_9SPHI|nr:RDD family protein [Mucilaginibacter mali]QKJ30811.1 RDD family protein [Mucilaginibacter mali]
MKVYHINYQTNIKRKIAATLIDYAIYFIFAFVYVSYMGTATEDGGKAVNGLPALPVFAVWFLYFVVTEAYNGSTPGHDICGLKVVKESGENITFKDALKRRILDVVDLGIWGIPAMICINNTPKCQRVGDLFAHTLVIRKTDIVVEEVAF